MTTSKLTRRKALKLSAAATAGLLSSITSSAREVDSEAGTPAQRSDGNATPLDAARIATRVGNRSSVVAANGMVCTSQPLAAAAGHDVLRSGGNAVDAAIAVNAVLSVVEPYMCGIGGDLFAIIWNEKQQQLFGLNGSGRSPREFSLAKAESMGLGKIPDFGPLSWSVPGCVDAWQTMLERFGSQTLGQLLAPAIAYATEGFPVSPIIAAGWKPESGAKHLDTLMRTYFPGGKAPAYGEIFHNPDIARAYELIAANGADDFYRGEIADRIHRFSARSGGLLTRQDLEEHQSEWVTPVSTNYHGYDVWQLPPNSQGIAVLQMLNMLERFDLSSMGANSAEAMHLIIEAKKLTFEDRARHYADPGFANVPVEQLISREYADARAKLINPQQAAATVTAGTLPDHSETIYTSVADADGNMVSLIQSNYSPWGSHNVVDGLGFCLQNRGSNFSLDQSHANRLEPGKRPFHTIIPGFVTRNGRAVMSLGVTGGSYQPQGQVHSLVNMLDFGMSVQQAAETLRVWHRGSSQPTGSRSTNGGHLTFEPGFSESTIVALSRLGHSIHAQTRTFGGYQAIWREDTPRRYFGGSDPRKDGCAIGF